MGQCLDYLRTWTGEEPTIGKELKSAMKASDAAFASMAFAGQWK
jgi:hypothetical protein